jgi:hypothetical protein
MRNTFDFNIDSYHWYIELFLAYVPKVGLCDLTLSCPWVRVSPIITFESLNQFLWNLVRISWQLSPSQRLLHKFLTSFCVSVRGSFLSLKGNGSVDCIPSFGARQRLGKRVPIAMNISNNRELLNASVSMWSMFYEMRVCECGFVDIWRDNHVLIFCTVIYCHYA